MTAIFAVVLPANAFANSLYTMVRGNVYGDNFAGLGGLTVTVTCADAVKNHVETKTAITDNYGLYTVNFDKNTCGAYQPITSTVTYKGQTQTQTVYVSHDQQATLDFYYGTMTSVPEFGLVTGAMAALTSGSSLFAFRRMRKA